MSKSPPITITSDELRADVEDRLDRWIPDAVWSRAEPYARHKLDLYRERWPDVGHYGNEYLVALTTDTVHEIELSSATLAACEAIMAIAAS